MAAAVVKGIIISISIITALGIAVLESPHIQAWLEEQRRKLVELLRNIGEELDPESRRAAEAFAFEGRDPAHGESTRREADGSIEAVAFATGRSLSGPSRIRHVPVRGPSTPDEAEQRQRLGEEYLARRSQQMIELRERNGASREKSITPSSTPTFDELVDDDGKLKQLEPRPIESIDAEVDNEHQPNPQASQVDDGFALGSRLANPFDDENALDRSETPRPPLPPKPQEYRNVPDPAEVVPTETLHTERGFPVWSETDSANLSFEEQLALALSLSEAEDQARFRNTTIDYEHDDPEIRAAIAASLKEFQATSAKVESSKRSIDQPLIDVSTSADQQLQQRIREWESSLASPSTETTMRAGSVVSEGTDDLYCASPQLGHRSLHDWQTLQPAPAFERNAGNSPHHPEPSTQQSIDGSFHSAMPLAATAGSRDANLASIIVKSHETSGPSQEQLSTTMDVDTETESFASVSRPMSVADSRAAFSGAEIVTDADETDHDVMSEDGDGILTPDSWSEVESRDGDQSEVERLGNDGMTRA